MGILSNIDETIDRSDYLVQLVNEKSTFPNENVFTRHMNPTTGVYQYIYKWNCLNFLKPITQAWQKISFNKYVFDAIEISIKIDLNYTFNGLRFAAQETHIDLLSTDGKRKNVFFKKEQGRARANLDIFADSLFRLQYHQYVASYFKTIKDFYELFKDSDWFRGCRIDIPEELYNF